MNLCRIPICCPRTLRATTWATAFLAAIAGSLLASQASGQTLYEETFPYLGSGGDIDVDTVGWQNDVPSNPNRLYDNAGGDGAVWSWNGAAAPDAFYTTTALDDGDTGMPFPSLDPEVNTNLEFSVDLFSGFNPENVSSYFAVLSGGSWYVTSTALPTATAVWTTHTWAFDPSAANWRDLTVTGVGSDDTSPIIGGPAASDLSGAITGAGVVVERTAEGTNDIDNFLITGDGGGTLTPGDTNGDDLVDIEIDFEAIRTHFLLTGQTRLQGDLTGNSIVDVYDFAEWKDAYLAAGGDAALIPALTPAPEPSALALLLAMACGTVRLRRSLRCS